MLDPKPTGNDNDVEKDARERKTAPGEVDVTPVTDVNSNEVVESIRAGAIAGN